MSSQKQAVSVRDLVEEAKKRIVILVICVVGLSYLLSLTSSSVLVNLPAAACLIILLRYFSFDVEMKRKAAAYNNSKPSLSLNKPPELPKAAPRSDWRSKVNSQVVEDAIDRFTRHLVSEWVLDLWYSRITPDKQGPEELVFIINHVLGELSRRFRNVNLIDLLTRDLIDIICRRVELFREYQAKIERKRRRSLSFEDRDSELRRLMAPDDKLHPALFSPEFEHKVLQHIVDRLITLTFRPEDLHCAFFHYTGRELLACCVMRPVVNLANPRFINERIEAAVISRIKTSDGSSAARETSQAEDLSEVSHDPFSRYLDPSVTGVELVQLKNEQQKRKNATDKQHVADLAKDPLLSMDTRSSILELLTLTFQKILLFHGYTIHLKILVVVSVNTVKGMNITSKHPDINLAGRDPDVLDTLPMMIAMIDDSENDSLARSCSGTSATSSASYISVAGSDLPNALKSSLLVDSFDKLRCEVLGSNIVKSSSKMFAVYSVAVTDESNHSWSIKRRFRHFEELHRRLKVFPEYNLHLPPKHFLSTGVDIPVIQERCVLLDDYLKVKRLVTCF
ncbi:hypothetical protein Bca52824_062932 [Brassica carinata]|uniref:Uncharacterized protein n=1 Tax=Brassica carinata TaxID=52824 RepID=A0A8X7QFH4_BRACI|nr:hypothetical protein Bca52824_062932 [Brassica carinata]